MMAVVGGAGSATGGLIASLLLTAVPELLRSLGETNFRLLVYGTMVLFVLWFVPGGIGGLIDQLIGRGARHIPRSPLHDDTPQIASRGVAQ